MVEVLSLGEFIIAGIVGVGTLLQYTNARRLAKIEAELAQQGQRLALQLDQRIRLLYRLRSLVRRFTRTALTDINIDLSHGEEHYQLLKQRVSLQPQISDYRLELISIVHVIGDEELSRFRIPSPPSGKMDETIAGEFQEAVMAYASFMYMRIYQLIESVTDHKKANLHKIIT